MRSAGAKVATRYNGFATQYDMVVGERRDVATFYRNSIQTFAPHAKTVLELGCGSGSMLKVLSRSYRATGIDCSADMLAVAKTKAPRARLLLGDITSFQLAEKFDAIISPFDTINHITSFRLWKRVFAAVCAHLAPEGVFIFDVNTESKMERYCTEPAAADIRPDSVAIVDVVRRARYRYEVLHRVFQRQEGAQFVLHEMRLPEYIVPIPQIRSALREYFRSVLLVDRDRARVSAATEELFCICRGPRR